MKSWLSALLLIASVASAAETGTISEADLINHIKGGWAGQMIGVTVGTPAEFQSVGEMYTKPIKWDPADLDVVFEQDDLYVEMTFMRVLEEKGLDATMVDFGKAFGESGYQLWHANFIGRKNIQEGIMPPESGHPKYNAHADDIDFQIESDFIGLMAPGMPNTAVDYADRVGHVMNYGDGVYGGMFMSAMYSTAFFSDDVNEVLEAGLAAIPKESEFYQALRDTVNFYKEHPDDLAAAWQLFEDKWANTDACSYGALRPFDIDAKTNSAYVAFGLLYGQGDFQKTIDASIKCGQDNDCNPASAAGVLGTMMGYDALPKEWRKRLEKSDKKKFSYTEYGFAEVCEQSLIQAKALIARNGGTVDGDKLTIVLQEPKPAPLEQWKQDEPVRRMAADDPALV
ncbi:MAG: ADP-ribosylglycohydrolase family protein, partial [Candidatus Hydrogenedentes bacterium]|nr:ADP-ribosylglycohydrolase family protein [Candidatus Hydrogenedentota bacterium]